MKAVEAQFEERMPAWEALSEFFLDTELQENDYDRIAAKLAATPYSVEKLEDILICEVCPVCRLNLLPIAGEWIGFDPKWLKKKVGARYEKPLLFKKLFIMRSRWMWGEHWDKVKGRVLKIRQTK